MDASVRRSPAKSIRFRSARLIMAVSALVALLASSCSGEVSGAADASRATASADQPPYWVASYVARATTQFGRADLIEWVKLPQEPEVTDMNGGVLTGLQLLDGDAEMIEGSTFFADFAQVPRPIGCYVVAAQGNFAARFDHRAAPAPGRTVLLLLDAVSVAGHDTFQMVAVGVYRESVHLDLPGTQVYWDGFRPADVPIDWRPEPQ